MLVKFIKDKSNNKIGCVVAVDRSRIGVSLLNPKDKFNKEVARNLAAGRALSGTSPNITSEKKTKLVSGEVAKMAGRAYVYFKKDYEEIYL